MMISSNIWTRLPAVEYSDTGYDDIPSVHWRKKKYSLIVILYPLFLFLDGGNVQTRANYPLYYTIDVGVLLLFEKSLQMTGSNSIFLADPQICLVQGP